MTNTCDAEQTVGTEHCYIYTIYEEAHIRPYNALNSKERSFGNKGNINESKRKQNTEFN